MGKNFVWYLAWKNHISLYPFSGATRRAFADEWRDRVEKDLSTSLVVRIVKARVAELR
jgi:hypothetical protein